VGGALYAAIPEPVASQPRWPESASDFAVEQWTVGSENVEQTNGSTYVTRALQGPRGASASLVIVTSRSAKLFGPGADVPFQGNGYDIGPTAPDLLTTDSGVNGFTASQGNERWLVLYAFGERRGLLGNGILGWSAAVFDGVLGKENDYYKIYLLTPLGGQDSSVAQESAQLARTLFKRIACWYGS
jgi:hypothetical protein